MSLVPVRYGFWVDWLEPQKVTFDGIHRLILINPGETEIDVQVDVYSAWKEWQLQEHNDNTKFAPAFRIVGGDPIGPGRSLGVTYFLANNWRMRTWEGDHRLVVKGNLYTEEGEPPFVPTINPHVITIESTVSNLVDRIETNVDVLIDMAAWETAKVSPDIVFVRGKAFVKIANPDLYG